MKTKKITKITIKKIIFKNYNDYELNVVKKENNIYFCFFDYDNLIFYIDDIYNELKAKEIKKILNFLINNKFKKTINPGGFYFLSFGIKEYDTFNKKFTYYEL